VAAVAFFCSFVWLRLSFPLSFGVFMFADIVQWSMLAIGVGLIIWVAGT
jgi:hypothetical protein